MQLADRQEAGARLAERLTAYAERKDAIVLALPRGGVPVAFEIARRLHLPLDVFLVRKLGMPGQEELAIGAIAVGGIRVLNREVLAHCPVREDAINAVAERESRELARRSHAYRDDKPFPSLRHRTVILVDDGIATGATMRAALTAIRSQGPERIIVAVPVAPRSVYVDLAQADNVICLLTPEPFHSVGLWYKDFSQITDQEVRELLAQAETFSMEAA